MRPNEELSEHFRPTKGNYAIAGRPTTPDLRRKNEVADRSIDGGDTQLALGGFQAGNLQAGGLLVALGLLAVVPGGGGVVGGAGLLAVAVVGLVVDDDNVAGAAVFACWLAAVMCAQMAA